VQRLPARIHRGHAGRGENDGTFASVLDEFAQQCGLAGASPAGEEQVALSTGALAHPFGGLGIDRIRRLGPA